MKTEKEIYSEMTEKVNEAKREKKRRPSLKKYERALKIVRVMSFEEIKRERDKVSNQLKDTMELFPKYLENFSAFKKSTQEHQERAVKDVFLKEFNVAELKRRIKELNYILN